MCWYVLWDRTGSVPGLMHLAAVLRATGRAVSRPNSGTSVRKANDLCSYLLRRIKCVQRSATGVCTFHPPKLGDDKMGREGGVVRIPIYLCILRWALHFLSSVPALLLLCRFTSGRLSLGWLWSVRNAHGSISTSVTVFRLLKDRRLEASQRHY